MGCVSLKASSILETLKSFIGTLCSANIDFFFVFLFYGPYYLDDAGYTNANGFLAPYRGQRTIWMAGQHKIHHIVLRNTLICVMQEQEIS
jgi:hypothetical protein